MAQGPMSSILVTNPDHCPDPGVRSPKYAFTGLSKKLPTDFDEILWRASVWPRDQHFGDDPHHYPDLGVRYIAKIIQQLLRWRSAGVCALWVLLV